MVMALNITTEVIMVIFSLDDYSSSNTHHYYVLSVKFPVLPAIGDVFGVVANTKFEY